MQPRFSTDHQRTSAQKRYVPVQRLRTKTHVRIKEICVGAVFADKNHPDMTAEMVFAGGVHPISAAV